LDYQWVAEASDFVNLLLNFVSAVSRRCCRKSEGEEEEAEEGVKTKQLVAMRAPESARVNVLTVTIGQQRKIEGDALAVWLWLEGSLLHWSLGGVGIKVR
jgi:hypothetical protein